MLYRRWLEVFRRHAASPAIMDGDRITTFADLAAAVSKSPVATGPVIARSGGHEFFVEILRAWRDGQPVIPVEVGMPDPILQGLPPAGTCLVKFTPGASLLPRGIFFNAEQVAADGDRLAAAMQLSPDIPNLAVISPAHSYGFASLVLPLVLHGVPVHLAASPFPRVVERIFQQHRRLFVPAVPSIWRAWHRAGVLKDAPIFFALSAGAPLALPLEKAVFAESGLKIHNFYGASECGAISLDLTEVPREFATDVGTPLPGVNLSVQPDGRLRVASSSVATAYDVQREDDLLGNGIYHTRDFGFLDSVGRVHLKGTTGHAINVAGRKVSPSRIEAALLATGLVRQARIYGVPSADSERCEEISVQVELMPGVTLAGLKGAVAEKLQAWEIPRHWQG